MTVATLSTRTEYATLSLTIEPESVFWPWPDADPPDTLQRMAVLLGTIDELAVLAVDAVRRGKPLCDLVFSHTDRLTPTSATFVGRSFKGSSLTSFAWDARYYAADDEERREMHERLRLVSGPLFRNSSHGSVRVVHLHTSSLDALLHLPWEWFGVGGGGVVFIRAVEYWLNTPQRIRAEKARLRAKESLHQAREIEAYERQLRALRDIELLRSSTPPAIRDGELDTPEPFDWPAELGEPHRS